MRPPTLFTSQCPKCKRTSGISVLSAGLFYLADQEWSCPHCRAIHTTEELHEAENTLGPAQGDGKDKA